MGHSYSVSLEETGVPLVILSPTAPAGRVVKQPVSLRDLPATVVDLLGISAKSPFPGRSLAATIGRVRTMNHPQISPAPRFQNGPANSPSNPMKATANNTMGSRCPWRLSAIITFVTAWATSGFSTSGQTDTKAGICSISNLVRQKWPVPQDAPRCSDRSAGSSEVEKAYLATYRNWLKELVQQRSTQSVASGGQFSPHGSMIYVSVQLQRRAGSEKMTVGETEFFRTARGTPGPIRSHCRNRRERIRLESSGRLRKSAVGGVSDPNFGASDFMDTTAARTPDRRRITRPSHTAPWLMIWLAVAFGLCAGYLDVAILVFRKYCWNSEGYFRNASDFPWTVPLGHAFLMLVGRHCVAVSEPRWPRLFQLRWRRGCSRHCRSGWPCCGCRFTVGAAWCWRLGWAG